MDNMTLGAAQALAKKLGADPALVTAAVEAWLDAHPEATTTVQDGSITKAKLDQILQGIVDDVPELKSAVDALDNAVEQLESGSLSALGASEGQVPIADGDGEWAWGDAPGGGGTVTDVQVNGVSVLDAQGVANITPSALDITQNVSGTTPSITALPGIRYICGEVATLDITIPASGIVDVVFESGSTPTVLTITPPTGMTMKWANGFDPTALETNTVYEINIMDGVYGVVGTWT